MEGIRTGYRSNTERFCAHLIRFLRQLLFQRSQICPRVSTDCTDFLLAFWRLLNFDSRKAGK